MTDKKTTTKCAECQFEELGKHSQGCSKYAPEPAPEAPVCAHTRCTTTVRTDELIQHECLDCKRLAVFGNGTEDHESGVAHTTPQTVDKPVERVHETNPNGANQFFPDPRQRLCWKLYITPGGKTFGNAKQSAILAGFTEDYACHITTAKWFTDKVRRMGLLDKAEKVLEEILNMPTEVVEIPRSSRRKNNDDEEDIEAETDRDMLVHDALEEEKVLAYMKTDPALIKIKQDTAKFIAERQGKDEGWNRRDELTGAGGKDLIPVDPKAKELGNKAIEDFLNSTPQVLTEASENNETSS